MATKDQKEQLDVHETPIEGGKAIQGNADFSMLNTVTNNAGKFTDFSSAAIFSTRSDRRMFVDPAYASEANYHTRFESIAGIMGIDFAPVITDQGGDEYTAKWSKQVWQNLKATSTTASDFSYGAITCATICVASIFLAVADLKRIINFYCSNPAYNDYELAAIYSAMGLQVSDYDIDGAFSNWQLHVGAVNRAILNAYNIKLPYNLIPVFKWWEYLTTSIFYDDAVPESSQLYVFKNHIYYKWDGANKELGNLARLTVPSNESIADKCHRIVEMLTTLNEQEDLKDLWALMLKTYGEESALTLTDIPGSTAETVPVPYYYDINVLNALHNATIFPFGFNATITVDMKTGYARPYISCGHNPGYIRDIAQSYISSRPIIDLGVANPTMEEVVNAVRWKFYQSKFEYDPNVPDRCYAIDLGTEVLCGLRVYTLSPKGTGRGKYEVLPTTDRWYSWYTVFSELEGNTLHMEQVQKYFERNISTAPFNYGPMTSLYIYYHDGSPTNGIIGYGPSTGFVNAAYIAGDYMNEIHRNFNNLCWGVQTKVQQQTINKAYNV